MATAYHRKAVEDNSEATYHGEEDSIELSDMKAGAAKGKQYANINQYSTEMSSSGRVHIEDEMDQTNKYMDDDFGEDPEADDEEEDDDGDSSEDEKNMATEGRDELASAQEQYDRQVGELYRQRRQLALETREAEKLRAKGRPRSPSKQGSDRKSSSPTSKAARGKMLEDVETASIKKKQNDFVEDCRKWFQADPHPRYLGNFLCFFYRKSTNEPLFCLGPDWVFSLVEFLVINVICGYFLYSMDKVSHALLFQIGLIMLVVQNISFGLTVFLNPGLPPRDVSLHSQSYLNLVKIFKYHMYCNLCKVVYREGQEQTEHCSDCGFCVEALDHHCPWSSKCIGRGNMTAFKIFLGTTVMLMVYLFSGGMLVVAAQ